MKKLTPAAQEVWDAFNEGWIYQDDITPSNLAAALRVASNWVVPPFISRPSTRTGLVKLNIRNRLQSIADQLEGRDATSI
jgi:hypothetical protein